MLIGKRLKNIYLLDLHHASNNIHYFLIKDDDTWFWRRRLCHILMHHLNMLKRKHSVQRLSQLKFVKDKVYEVCQKGKQTKFSFKPKKWVSTNRPLQLLHIFGPSWTMSLSGNFYELAIVNDFSCFTWNLASKNDTYHVSKRLAKVLENKIKLWNYLY